MVNPDTRGLSAVSCELLDLLHRTLPFKLWMLHRLNGQTSVVLACRDDYYSLEPGDEFPWADTLCQRVVEGEAPNISANVAQTVEFNGVKVLTQMPINTYCGVPVMLPDGTLFGMLCGIDPEPSATDIDQYLPMVKTCAHVLGQTLWMEEQLNAARTASWQADLNVQVDPLTGLANFHGWAGKVQSLRRMPDLRVPTAVIYLDVFTISDLEAEYGRSYTDIVLKKVANILRLSVRGTDFVARIGTGEFGVLLHNVPMDCVETVSRRIQERLSEAGVDFVVGAAHANGHDELHSMLETATRRSRLGINAPLTA